ncbi:MAG: hypothetical protein ACOC1O_04550 [bacterium]
MNELLDYLKEREEYFFEKEEPEDSIEEPEDSVEDEDYGLDFVDDEEFFVDEIDVEEIPDNSDPILNADEFIKSNSDIMDFYSKGKGFDLTDNLELYEVVKMVKDLLDKHLFQEDVTWKVDIANRKAIFTFKIKGDNNKYFLHRIQYYVINKISVKFSNVFDIKTKLINNSFGNENVMIMIINEKEKEADISGGILK